MKTKIIVGVICNCGQKVVFSFHPTTKCSKCKAIYMREYKGATDLPVIFDRDHLAWVSYLGAYIEESTLKN